MITRGEQWGVPTTRTEGDVLVSGDSQLAASSTESRLIVTGGDIAHCLGDPLSPEIGANCIEVPIDALRVSITMRNGVTLTQIAASHVVIGSWLRGRLVCLSNGGFIGPKNVSPRAHPNDGLFDVMSLDSSMGVRQRIRARQKSTLGTHLPHPLLETSRSRSANYAALSRNEALQIDGVRIRRWTSVHIEIVPDYWRLLV
jgi:hypothetical protein